MKAKTLNEYNSGDVIKWNGYEWIVIDDGYIGKRILLMKDILKMAPFDDREEGYTNNWKESTAREYLNGEFYDSLKDKDPICDFMSDLTADNGDTDYGSSEDKIFLIDCNFYRKHRKEITPACDWWWTITPYASNSCNARYVSAGGSLNHGSAYAGHSGLRPACLVSSDILISETENEQETKEESDNAEKRKELITEIQSILETVNKKLEELKEI